MTDGKHITLPDAAEAFADLVAGLDSETDAWAERAIKAIEALRDMAQQRNAMHMEAVRRIEATAKQEADAVRESMRAVVDIVKMENDDD